MCLEGELGAESERRRSLNQQRRSPERIDGGRNARNTTVNREGLVQSYGTLAIEYVEPIATQSQLFSFTNSDRIVDTQVQIHRGGRSGCTDAVDDVRESRVVG